MQHSVVLTAELLDEMSAPMEKMRKGIEGTTTTVEKSTKAQASSTKEAASVMTTALDRASGASSDMGKAMERASGTGGSAWGKLRTEVTQASNDAITAARKQATELSASVDTQSAALEKLQATHNKALNTREQTDMKAAAAQQHLDEIRGQSVTKASDLTKAEAGLADASFKADQAIENAQQSAADLAAGREKLTATTRELGEAQDIAGQKLTGFAKLTEGVTQRQRDAISTLAPAVAVVGGAMTAGFGVMLKTYADFDQAMSAVQAATHESTGNMKLLREEAIRVGADTAFSAGEAAQGIEELAKAGVSTEAILKGGLSGALDLAAAGQLGVGEAAEIAATAMTQFKLEGDQIPHLADLLAAGAGKAMGSVQDLGGALNQAGLVASATGLTIEETTGTLAAFASNGMIGSDAGTSLKSMLQRLQNPANKASKEMEALGINMYDANGNFAGMDVLAGQLKTGMEHLTQAERDKAMATIFGSDAVRAANVLYTEGAAGIQNWTAAVDDAGYAAKTAAQLQDNLAGDLERLGGSFDTVFLKAGGSANDVLRDLVQILESVVDRVGQIPTPVLSVLGILTGLTGGTLLLVGTIGMLAPKLKDGMQALRDLTKDGTKADTAMRGLGRGAKFAAAGIGALSIVGPTVAALVGSGNTAQAKALSDALYRMGAGGKAASTGLGDLDKMFTGKGSFMDGLDVKGLEGAFKVIGNPSISDNVDKTLSSILSFGTRSSSNIEFATKNFAELDGQLANMASSGATDQASAAYDQLAQAALDAGVPAEKLTEIFPNYNTVLASTASASQGAATATEVMDAALEETGVTVEGVVEDMEKFLELLFATGLATMSARDASAAFHEATRGTSDAIKAAKDALQAELETKGHSAEAAKALAEQQYNLGAALLKNKSDFDITTAAGAALNEGFQNIARSGMADIEAASKAGMGQDELQGKLRITYDALVKDANQKGIVGQAAQDLARDVMDIPAKANIDTWMDDRAKEMAEQTKTAVDAVPGEVKVGSSMDDNALTMAQRTSQALNGIPSVKNVRVVTNHVELPAPTSMGERIANSWKAPGASGGAVFMAAGGAVLPGYAPGVDDIPVMASRGESILVPELTRAIGPSNIMALNHEYSNGRPAGAGPARNTLSQVLGMATSQTMTTNNVTSTLSSYTPAAGGAVLSGMAPSAGQAAQLAPAGAQTKSGAPSFTFAPHIEVSGGGAEGQAIADDLEGRMRGMFNEFVDELGNDMDRMYA